MRNRTQVEVTAATGDKTTVSQHSANADEYGILCTPGSTKSEVEVGVGSALPFGEFKVFVRVVLQCDQSEKALDAAGTLAYLKAREYAQDAMNNYLVERAEAAANEAEGSSG